MNFMDKLLGGPSSGAQVVFTVASHWPVAGETKDEIVRKVRALSASLLEAGVRQSDPVLLMSSSRTEMLIGALAVFHIGATLVPVTAQMGRETLRFIIETMRPTACIVETPLSGELLSVLSRTCRVSVCINLPPQQQGQHTPYRSFASMLRADASPRAGDCREDDLAIVVHSSGSEGRPKSVIYTYRDLDTFLECYHQLSEELAPVAEAMPPPVLSPQPLAHLSGLCFGIESVRTDKPVYLFQQFTPEVFLALVQAIRPRGVLAVPSMVTSLMKLARRTGQTVPPVKYCLLAGEPFSLQLADEIEAFFGATVVSIYGMSECQAGIGYRPEHFANNLVRRGSCGKHVAGEVKLVGPDGLVQSGEGELWVKNATVHRCYLDERLNRERLQDGWYRTGDLFQMDEEGYFFYKGRVDQMFVCNGRNIFPREIETVLLGHPQVRSVCAVPIHDREGRSVPAVLIEAREPTRESDIMEYALKHGASHAVPRCVKFVDALPLMGPGKVDRRECTRMLQAAFEETMRRRAAAGQRG